MARVTELVRKSPAHHPVTPPFWLLRFVGGVEGMKAKRTACLADAMKDGIG
jgi:hypothetical protein